MYLNYQHSFLGVDISFFPPQIHTSSLKGLLIRQPHCLSDVKPPYYRNPNPKLADYIRCFAPLKGAGFSCTHVGCCACSRVVAKQ
jgi:hypothetical protein